MKYELLLFDADGTLFDFEAAEKYALGKTMGHFEVPYDEAYHLKHYKEINSALWGEFEQELITAEGLKAERFRRFFGRLGMSIEASQASLRYLDFLSEASFLYEHALEVVESLYKTYRLVLITNGLSAVQNIRIKSSPIFKYFETMIISEEVGVAKPNPKIFDHTFNKIGHSCKETALIIGDSLKSDIQGGVNFGIDTCWYNPKAIEKKSDISPTYEIKDLRSLIEIL